MSAGHECIQKDRIVSLEINDKIFMEKLNNIEKKQDSFEKKQDSLIESMNTFMLDLRTNYVTKKDADKLYSSKWAERITFAMVGMILIYVFGKILGMIG